MAMGIVNDDVLLKELTQVDKPVPKPTAVIKQDEVPGRNKGDKNVPSALRALISESAQLDGRKEGLELAKSFGISNSSVSAYTREVNSTTQFQGKKAPEIKNHVDRIKKNISKKARGVLREALENITPDKLADSKATELAQVAKSMSSIITEMEPPADRSEDKSVPQIVIYAPQMRTEQSFEFININE